MPRPAEPRDAVRGRKPRRREPRPDIDRAWLWRALLAAVVIALVLLIAKAATMAFGGAGRRVDARVVDPSDTLAPARLQVLRKVGW